MPLLWQGLSLFSGAASVYGFTRKYLPACLDQSRKFDFPIAAAAALSKKSNINAAAAPRRQDALDLFAYGRKGIYVCAPCLY
jgi:hypothetical protein